MRTSPNIRQSFSTRKFQIVVGLAIVIPLIAVMFFAKLMYPLQRGTSSGFWLNVCGIDLDGKKTEHTGGFYLPKNGWYIYYDQGYHGQFLHRVPSAAAIADFPRIISKLKQFSNTNSVTRLPFWAKTALENNPSAEQNPEKFLSSVRDERLKAFRKKDEHLYQYVLAEEQDFNLRWKRIQNFWLNIVFECVFFSGLILFSLWPWLRRKGVHAWCVHLSLMPLLLFLPYYLGYCGWTFTSAGPSGGILYPLTIFRFRDWLFWTPIDQWLIVSSPKILEPISQDLGPMISVSGGRPLGIIVLLLIGCVIYVCVWTIAKFVAFMSRPKSLTN